MEGQAVKYSYGDGPRAEGRCEAEEAVMWCWKLLAFFVSAFVVNPGVVTEATMPEQHATHAFPDKWTHRDATGASALRACLLRWDFRFIVGWEIPHGDERTMNERLRPRKCD